MGKALLSEERLSKKKEMPESVIVSVTEELKLSQEDGSVIVLEAGDKFKVMNERFVNFKTWPIVGSKDLGEKIYDMTDYSFDPIPQWEDGEFPMPWDAEVRIEGRDVILEGGAGSSGYGYAKTKYPLNPNSAKNPPVKWDINSDNPAMVAQYLESMGWFVDTEGAR